MSDANPLAGFVDVANLAATISRLHQAFPKHFTHTFAAKANPMSCALALVKEHGMAEVK